MPAYNFQSQFAEAVARGDKCQTIRANGKRRHASPGERLQLYTGMRTKACRKLVTPDPVCVSTLRVELVSSNVARFSCFLEIDRVRLSQEQEDAFAQADGFSSFYDMVEWFKKTHGLPFEGVLIRWQHDSSR